MASVRQDCVSPPPGPTFFIPWALSMCDAGWLEPRCKHPVLPLGSEEIPFRFQWVVRWNPTEMPGEEPGPQVSSASLLKGCDGIGFRDSLLEPVPEYSFVSKCHRFLSSDPKEKERKGIMTQWICLLQGKCGPHSHFQPFCKALVKIVLPI